MLLLAIASILFFLCTYSIGFYSKVLLEKIWQIKIEAGLVDVFLLGLLISFIYFNVLSFFVPLNEWVLIPFAFTSLFFLWSERQFLTQVTQALQFLKSPTAFIIFIPLFAILFFYWIAPSMNLDSRNYHILSIKWYHNYSVIPGLANIHGRFAFNPASFVLAAPYSFETVLQQAIYPINGVVVVLFSLWWFKRVCLQIQFATAVILFIAGCFIERQLFVNVSSPSSDVLASILIAYVSLSLFEKLQAGKKEVTHYAVFLLFIIWGITCKLSLLPLLLFIPLLFFFVPDLKQIKWLAWVVFFAVLIWLPWLFRNFIMSGYFIYPATYTGIFNVDWKAPEEIAKLDYVYIKYGPLFFSEDPVYLKSLGSWQWIPIWFKSHFAFGKGLDFVSLLLALFSPLYWILFKHKKTNKAIFALWLTVFMACCWWLFNSPEYRFGAVFLICCFMIPLIFVLERRKINQRIVKGCMAISLFIFATYYIKTLQNNHEYYTAPLSSYLIYPLKDKGYFSKNNLSTTNCISLNNTIKLFKADREHHCNNCPLPCMVLPYGEVELRGTTLQQGFRIKKNEVLKNYPFLK